MTFPVTPARARDYEPIGDAGGMATLSPGAAAERLAHLGVQLERGNVTPDFAAAERERIVAQTVPSREAREIVAPRVRELDAAIAAARREAIAADRVARPGPSQPRIEQRMESALGARIQRFREGGLDGHELNEAIRQTLAGLVSSDRRQGLGELRQVTLGELRSVIARAGVPESMRSEALQRFQHQIAFAVHQRVVDRAEQLVERTLTHVERLCRDPRELATLEHALFGGGRLTVEQARQLRQMLVAAGGSELEELLDQYHLTRDNRGDLRAQIVALIPGALANVLSSLRETRDRIRQDLALDGDHMSALRDFRAVTYEVLREHGVTNPSRAVSGVSERSSIVEDSVARFISDDAARRELEAQAQFVVMLGLAVATAGMAAPGLVGFLVGMAGEGLQTAIEIDGHQSRASQTEFNHAIGLQTEAAAREERRRADHATIGAVATFVGGSAIGGLAEVPGMDLPRGTDQVPGIVATDAQLRSERPDVDPRVEQHGVDAMQAQLRRQRLGTSTRH